MRKFLENNSGALLIPCFILFSILSWIILFRDGRGLFTFVDFYPSIRPFIEQATILLQKWGINFIPTILFALTAIFAFYLYFVSLKKGVSLRNTIIYSVIFQIITFFAYPILARDIFYYIFSDRVLHVYHQNVWKVPLTDFLIDKFSKTDWQVQTKVYGGVNQFFYNFASTLSGNDLIQSLLAYKGLALIFSFGTMFVVYKITQKYFPQKKSFILRLLFWNPLYILEIAGAGHNDIIMIFFLLLSLYFYLGKSWLLTGVSLALSVGVKMVALLAFPFLVLDAIWKKQIKNAFLFVFSFIAVNLLTFKYMDVEPLFFIRRVVENAGIYWQGLPSLAYKFYPVKTPLFLFGAAGTSMLLAFYQLKKRLNPFLIYTFAMFLYLSFFAGAYWNWYVLWVFVFTPFIKENALTKAVLALTFTSLTAYPLYWISLRFDYQNIAWQFIFYAWIFIVPIAVFFYCRRHPAFLNLGNKS